MARPIPLELPKHDPREELRVRLQQAPAEHAEAVLASFEVLQGLHDCGVLEQDPERQYDHAQRWQRVEARKRWCQECADGPAQHQQAKCGSRQAPPK